MHDKGDRKRKPALKAANAPLRVTGRSRIAKNSGTIAEPRAQASVVATTGAWAGHILELTRIERFVAVAEELNYTQAARRLGVSQPQLSQQIKKLEHEVGTRIFERNKRSVRLTKAGEAMLAEAYRLIQQSERVRSAARRSNAGEIGRITVGCVTSAFYQTLPPVLSRYRALHPRVGISLRELDTTDAIPELLNRHIDVAFIRLDAVDPPLELWPLTRDRLVAALPANHPLARRGPVAIEDLGRENFAMFDRRLSPRYYDSIVRACLEAGFSPKISHQSTSILSQIGIVACGLAVTLVPESMQRLQMPSVVFRELAKAVSLTDIALVWQPRADAELIGSFVAATKELFPDGAA